MRFPLFMRVLAVAVLGSLAAWPTATRTETQSSCAAVVESISTGTSSWAVAKGSTKDTAASICD